MKKQIGVVGNGNTGIKNGTESAIRGKMPALDGGPAAERLVRMLFEAAHDGNVTRVREAVEKGAGKDSINKALVVAAQKCFGPCCHTHLADALAGKARKVGVSEEAKLEVVKFLVGKGASLEYKDEHGFTANQRAAAGEHWKIVGFLNGLMGGRG